MYHKLDLLKISMLKKISKIALLAATAVTFSQASGSAMYQPVVTDEMRDRLAAADCKKLPEKY